MYIYQLAAFEFRPKVSQIILETTPKSESPIKECSVSYPILLD